MAKNVPRKVAFYRVTTGIDENTHLPRTFDCLRLLQHTADLEYEFRKVPLDKGVRRVVGEVHKSDGYPLRMSAGLVDTESVPQLEKEGKWKHIRPAAGEGVGAKSHACFFENGNAPIVGFIQQTGSATCQMLRSVFTCRNFELDQILEFEEIIRGNPIERLERATAGRFTFGIRRNALSELSRIAPDLAAGFRTLGNETGAELFELTISVQRFQRDEALGGRFRDFLRDLRGMFDRHPRDVPKATAKIREGDDAAAVLLNLLTDKFVIDANVPTISGTKNYRDEDAFSVIERVYNQNAVEIRRALTLMGAVRRDQTR